MKNYSEYHVEIKDLFSKFLSHKDVVALVSSLRLVEDKIIDSYVGDDDDDKELWFRFFKGDESATTIDGLLYYLSDKEGHKNYNIGYNNIQIAVDPNNDNFYVYYY